MLPWRPDDGHGGGGGTVTTGGLSGRSKRGLGNEDAKSEAQK